MQILDCDYTMLNGKPLIRIFGKTTEGRSLCIFANRFLPYFYLLPHGGQDFGKIKEELKRRYDVSFEECERLLPIGYGHERKGLKIIGRDPGKIPEIKELAKKFGTPYEADILFKYRYMVDHGLKGMCWVEAEGKYVGTKTVRCKAFEAEKITPLNKQENAPLKYMALDIECMTDDERRLPDAEKDNIIIMSLAFFPDYKGKEKITFIAKRIGFASRGVICFDNENDMLKKFSEILQDFDPDILIGYNINNYDLPYIVKRLDVLQLPKDLGRAEKQVFLKKLQAGLVPSIVGRAVVDPYEILKRDPWVKFKRYDLGTVAKALLNEDKIEIDGIREMREMWNGGDLKKFIDYSQRDAELALKLIIEKNLLDKFFELAKVSGLLLQDSLGGQSQRHECKLLHEFFRRGILMPCKPEALELRKYKDEREKKGLKGALVLEPQVGLHKSVLVLDFASLYPSIIRTYNVCPTTLLIEGEAEHITTPSGAKFVTEKVREGVLPSVLKELMEARKAVKKQMKSETDKEKTRVLNAKQLALKDMANSLYGYTGYIRARLYVMDVANSITAYGRENITKTKKIIEDEFPVEVLYGDTDSMFIKTSLQDLEEARKLGSAISESVSKKLSGYLSLEFEKIYKTFLILTKKRYAGWRFEKISDCEWKDKIEMKGIETVRRDWCSLTTETMLQVIDIVLKEGDIAKAAKYVRSVIDDLAAGKIPLEKLTIVKGLTKTPDSYDGVQPHAELAKKISSRDPTRAPMVGERLGYVIIKGNQLISKRAEDPEFVKQKGLEIDPQYYIENQLLPPLERVFEVCGIAKTELIEGSKQRKLFEIIRQEIKQPEQTVFKEFESVACKKCSWSFRRVPLAGACPKCGSHLFFSSNGSLGAFVELKFTS